MIGMRARGILAIMSDQERRLQGIGTREKLEKGTVKEQRADVCQLLPRQIRGRLNQRESRLNQTNLTDLPRWRLFWSNSRLAPSIIVGMRRIS
jgi:hypothetical protein